MRTFEVADFFSPFNTISITFYEQTNKHTDEKEENLFCGNCNNIYFFLAFPGDNNFM